MAKYNLNNLIKISAATLGLVSILASQACFRNIRNPSCHTWDLENRRKLQTCVSYGNNGKPVSTRYTVFNGWGFPVVATYDKGIDGPDGNVEYTYNRFHKLHIKKGDFNGNNNRLEERFYDKDGEIVMVIVDEDGDGYSDKIWVNRDLEAFK